MASGAGGDESLEIVFWWLEGHDGESIEDELDTYLEHRTPRRRRLPWPGRRSHAERMHH
jgi:hypothetical protein